jgi:hypothetical protein
MAVLLVTYLVRGEWSNGLHQPLAAASLVMPVAGLMFVPVLAGMPWLYPWVASRPDGTFKAIYLAPWFFVLRSMLYFAVWWLVALRARRAWGDIAQMVRVASIGLILYALTGSLAAVDWIESLDPAFHSSIYGLLVMTFQVLAGLSFGIAMAVAASPRARDLPAYGPLLLSTLLLWAYMHAMQYIIIWAGNIPEEVLWYIRRSSGGWAVVLWGLIGFQFLLPFFAMLLDRVRNRPFPLLIIAGGTLALRFVESCLLVLPAAQARGAVLWLAIPSAVALAVGVLGAALQFSLARMERSAADARLLPVAG